MTDLVASPESDIRFQFQVIADLAGSLRQHVTSTERLTNTVAEVQKTQVNMLERLARIEANTVNQDVADLKIRVGAVESEVDLLNIDKATRIGAANVGKSVMGYWPVITMIGVIFYVLLSATGIVTLPGAQPSAPLIHPPARSGS